MESVVQLNACTENSLLEDYNFIKSHTSYESKKQYVSKLLKYIVYE